MVEGGRYKVKGSGRRAQGARHERVDGFKNSELGMRNVELKKDKGLILYISSLSPSLFSAFRIQEPLSSDPLNSQP
jgi:hypothetical protein